MGCSGPVGHPLRTALNQELAAISVTETESCRAERFHKVATTPHASFLDSGISADKSEESS